MVNFFLGNIFVKTAGMDKYKRMFCCPGMVVKERIRKENESKISGFLAAIGRRHNFFCEIRKGAKYGKKSISGNARWVD